MKYSNERKRAVLAKTLSTAQPLDPRGRRRGRDFGGEATLYNWRKQARARGQLYPGAGSDAELWALDNFAAVLETTAMNESQRGDYWRKRGLYPEQLAAFRSIKLRAGKTRHAGPVQHATGAGLSRYG